MMTNQEIVDILKDHVDDDWPDIISKLTVDIADELEITFEEAEKIIDNALQKQWY